MSRQNHAATYALFCSALALVTGCNVILGQTLVGSGVSKTENRDVGPFAELELSGAVDATVSFGEPQSIEITGDDNVVPLIVSEVSDGVLRIWTDHQGSLKLKEDIKVTIVTPSLDRIEVSGACSVNVDEVSADKFTIQLSGASTIDASGQCEQLVANVSGASKLRCVDLEANSAKVKASGASSARVHATDSIDGRASGASSLRYAGNPETVKVNNSGASSIGTLD